MARGKDLIGIKFGKLTPIKLLEERRGNYRYWLCNCDCGNTKEIRSSHLLKGYSKSCGCSWHYKNKNHSNWQGYEDIPLDFFNNIKRGAESRKIEFNITIEYLWSVFLKQEKKCALSGIDLLFADTRKNKNNKKNVSIDRIDSNKGYIEGNVQWVHKTINIMKNKLSDEEFISFCNHVYNKNKPQNGPYSLFIGRWQPPHIGHMYLFNEALKNGKKVLIAIRDIQPDEKNPLFATEVKELWEKVYEGKDVEVIIIPDIESVNWGRGVGYQTIEHIPPSDIENISATQIRKEIREGSENWKSVVDSKIHENIFNLLK